MEVIVEVIKSLQAAKIPTILVVGGILFIFLAIGGGIVIPSHTGSVNRKAAGFLGALFLILGVVLSIPISLPSSEISEIPTPTMALTIGPTQLIGATSTGTVVITFSCDDPTDVELLDAPWRLEGNVGKGSFDAQPEIYQAMQPDILQGKDVLRIRIDLNGASFNEGSRKDESTIIIDQLDQNGQWTVASVATHGIENGKDGEQVIYIPLADFEGLNNEGIANRGYLDLTKSYGPLHARFWNEVDFVVEIFSIVACNSQPGQ